MPSDASGITIWGEPPHTKSPGANIVSEPTAELLVPQRNRALPYWVEFIGKHCPVLSKLMANPAAEDRTGQPAPE